MYEIILIFCRFANFVFPLPFPFFFFFQSPPKGATIPYRPKPASTPVIFSGGQVRAELALQHHLLACAPNQLQTFTATSATTCVCKHFKLVALACHGIPFTNEQTNPTHTHTPYIHTHTVYRVRVFFVQTPKCPVLSFF